MSRSCAFPEQVQRMVLDGLDRREVALAVCAGIAGAVSR